MKQTNGVFKKIERINLFTHLARVLAAPTESKEGERNSYSKAAYQFRPNNLALR